MHRLWIFLLAFASCIPTGCDHEASALTRLSGEVAASEIKWSFRTEKPNGGKALVVDDVVYFGSDDGQVYALSRVDGKKLWDFKAGDPINTGVVHHRDSIIFATTTGKVFAVDAATGDELWSYKAMPVIDSPPAVDKAMVFVSNRTSRHGRVWAIRATTGRRAWKLEFEGSVKGSVVVRNGVLYVCEGIGRDRGVFHAIKARRKQPLWTKEFDQGLVGTPQISRDRACLAGRNGMVCAIDLDTQKTLWKHDVSGVIHASPTVANGSVFVGDQDGKVHAFDLESGTKSWTSSVDFAVYGELVIEAGIVYVGSRPGEINALSASSGRRLWQMDWAAKQAEPVLHDGVMYVSSPGEFVALQIR